MSPPVCLSIRLNVFLSSPGLGLRFCRVPLDHPSFVSQDPRYTQEFYCSLDQLGIVKSELMGRVMKDDYLVWLLGPATPIYRLCLRRMTLKYEVDRSVNSGFPITINLSKPSSENIPLWWQRSDGSSSNSVVIAEVIAYMEFWLLSIRCRRPLFHDFFDGVLHRGKCCLTAPDCRQRRNMLVRRGRRPPPLPAATVPAAAPASKNSPSDDNNTRLLESLASLRL